MKIVSKKLFFDIFCFYRFFGSGGLGAGWAGLPSQAPGPQNQTNIEKLKKQKKYFLETMGGHGSPQNVFVFLTFFGVLDKIGNNLFLIGEQSRK